MLQAFFFKTLGGKEAMPPPLAPVVMLPQVPLFGVQPPSISQTDPMGASGFTGQLWRYSAASVPQCAERLG